MANNLSKVLEHWATIYKPISHNPAKKSKDKAFYAIKTINTESEFMRNQNTAKSPCMAYSVLVDARGENSHTISYAHTIYFLYRAVSNSLTMTGRQDDDIAQDLHIEMDDYVQDLLAYLRKVKREGSCPVTGLLYDEPTIKALQGLDIDHAEWGSIPMKYGNWHIMAVHIDQIAPRVGCIREGNYHFPAPTSIAP